MTVCLVIYYYCFLLKYSWHTVLHQFQVYNPVIGHVYTLCYVHGKLLWSISETAVRVQGFFKICQIVSIVQLGVVQGLPIVPRIEVSALHGLGAPKGPGSAHSVIHLLIFLLSHCVPTPWASLRLSHYTELRSQLKTFPLIASHAWMLISPHSQDIPVST